MGSTSSSQLAAKEEALMAPEQTRAYIKPSTAPIIAKSPTAERAKALKARLAEAPSVAQAEVRRWDGERMTISTMRAAIVAHVKEHTLETSPGFVRVGGSKGILYEENKELTAASGGDSYARLSGELSVPAGLMTALLLDPTKTGYMDKTVATLDFFQPVDQSCWLAYWCAMPPGGLFSWRDGVDLTCYEVEGDSVFQVSVSCVEDEVASLPGAVRAQDQFWGYCFTPLDGGKRCKAVLICQTAMKGCMPQCLKNKMANDVLGEYMRTLEEVAKRMIAAGTAEAFVKNFPGLSL